ncbi:MAG: hypothetical protein MUQ56_03870 [Thermoleophilia bacterium]|nr:hypothetical protein [Thermoleophilia bacterium]
MKIWIGLGLAFVVLNLGNVPQARSPYWFSELVLYGLMLAGLWANSKHDLRKKIRIPRKLAPAGYVLLVWLFGMMFEAGLTVTGEGIGGVHPETLPSFILAQGDYVPIALITYLVIRRTQASFRQVFFFAGGIGLTEGLIFTGALTSVLLSPMFFLSPILVAYYTIAYSSFIALPLLLIDEELLWKEPHGGRQHSIPFFCVLGFILALAIRTFWGLVYGPIATQLFHLPPNS